MTGGRGPDGVIDAVGMEAHGSPVGRPPRRRRAAAGCARPAAGRQLGIDRLAAFDAAVKAVRRGGTVSGQGVYGGEVDPMPMMEMFDRGSSCGWASAHVKRWIDDILPLVAGPRRPAWHPRPDHAPLAAWPTPRTATRCSSTKQDGCIKVVLTP